MFTNLCGHDKIFHVNAPSYSGIQRVKNLLKGSRGILKDLKSRPIFKDLKIRSVSKLAVDVVNYLAKHRSPTYASTCPRADVYVAAAKVLHTDPWYRS